MNAAEKIRENRIRRVAARQRLRLERSRQRDPRAVDYGRYQLIDIDSNIVVLGGGEHTYSVTLDEIGEYLNEPADEAEKPKRGRKEPKSAVRGGRSKRSRAGN
jgi:hypothetical protein